jgi:hypothetical protein
MELTRTLTLLLLLTVSAVAQVIPPPEAINRNELKHLWIFPGGQKPNGSSPATLLDATKNLNATIAGSPAMGVYGGRVGLNLVPAGSQFVRIGDKRLTNDFTLAVWFRVVAHTANANEYIVSKVRSIGNVSYGIQLRDFGSGYPQGLAFTLYTGAAYYEIGPNDNNYLVGTGWHHVAATYKPSSGSQRLYLDGRLVAFTNRTPANISYDDGETQAGAYNNLQLFTGQLSGLRVYERAISQDEIKLIYRGIQ